MLYLVQFNDSGLHMTVTYAAAIVYNAVPRMANEETLYAVADRVATRALKRPDKLNAWIATMEQEIRTAVEGAEGRSSQTGIER